ncbi:MAG: FtsX-like permease family protein, partial [Chitinophagaceae bacterium]|nr:FtsX-like permease family protein [Chitinophagaceae bacterium]
MIKNYFKIAFRNLIKNKFSSLINIGGLAIGMTVAMLIGLWIYDEFSFDKNFKNYHRIAQVLQNNTMNGETGTGINVPHPLGEELRKNFGSDFEYVTMASWNENHILAGGEKNLSKNGTFFQPQAIEMLSLKMLNGNRDALNDPSSIMLSASSAKAYFGNNDPMGKIMKMDNNLDLKVTGVYEDLPYNSSFADVSFIAPWQLFANSRGLKNDADPWRCNCYFSYIQLAGNADINKVSAKIKDVKLNKVDKSELKQRPAELLHPMSKWNLYSEFKNGVIAGGRIQ